MRQTRTPDEMWAIARLLAHLQEQESGWTEDAAFQDNPDLVLDGPGDPRVACELSTVGINEWYRWKNDHSLDLDIDKLDSMIVPREPNIWIGRVIEAKNPKVGEYKAPLKHGSLFTAHRPSHMISSFLMLRMTCRSCRRWPPLRRTSLQGSTL